MRPRETSPPRGDITALERRALGVLTFLVSVVPVAVVVGAIIISFADVSVPDWFFKAAFVSFLIAAGLHRPLFLICRAAARDSVLEAGKAFPIQLLHPFSLFGYWWRNVR